MATKKTSKPKKHGAIARFEALSPAEKERGWKSYNRVVPLSETRPLTAAERKSFDANRRKPGRPPRGAGAKPVNVTIEKALLARADAYAAAHNLSRAALISRGLELALAARP